MWNDLDGNYIPLDYNLTSFGAGPYPDILLLHHHNAGADNRAELVPVVLSNDDEIDVEKTVDNDEPAPGDTVTYTITATNNGPAEANGLVLQDTLPAGLTYVSSNCPGATTAPGAGGSTIITCTMAGTLPNGFAFVYTIVATVDATADGQYTNTVALTGWDPAVTILRPVGQAGPDSDSVSICVGTDCQPVDDGGGGGTGGVSVSVFDPAISKVGALSAGGLGLPGEQLTWTLTITNTGNTAGTNVVVVDTIRPELRIDSVDIDTGAATVDGQTVTFFIPVLDPGETIQARIHTTVVQSPAAGEFANTATISGQGPSGTVTDSGSAIVTASTLLPSTGYPPAESSDSSHTVLVLALGGLIVVSLCGVAIRRSRRHA